MEELKKAKLDHPGPPPDHELPQQPFGKLGWNFSVKIWWNNHSKKHSIFSHSSFMIGMLHHICIVT